MRTLRIEMTVRDNGPYDKEEWIAYLEACVRGMGAEPMAIGVGTTSLDDQTGLMLAAQRAEVEVDPPRGHLIYWPSTGGRGGAKAHVQLPSGKVISASRGNVTVIHHNGDGAA